MRILVLCDDVWHPAGTLREGLAPLSEQGLELAWITDAADWSASRMADYPVVLFSKSNNVSQADKRPWMTETVEQAFVDYVRGGGGLLVVHSGTAGYAEAGTLRALMGGVFTEHPPQCPVTVIPKTDHSLTAGVHRFTATDEHYFMSLDDEAADVFLTTLSEHGTQPGGWTRTEGAGRVVVLTPGHTVEVWLTPSFQTLLVNGLQWCAGGVS